MKNTVQTYKVYNLEKENCPVCEVFNGIYGPLSFQKEMEIPGEAGKGYCRRIMIKPSMEINISDLTLHEGVTMEGGMDHHNYSLAFCLEEGFQWRFEGNKKEYEMTGGESYIFKGIQGNGICRYNPDQRFLGLGIRLDSEVITSLVDHMGKEYARTQLFYGSNTFYKIKFSSAVRLILNEMINCRYRDDIKRIYLEGKVLELIAVFLDELTCQKGETHASTRLSLSDITSLHEARRILDENIASPPTIGKLARMVCLNEYKLKRGFKALYEMPVHAYIIDKRLELARCLMEDKKLRVTEAVLQVGYSDASHFAEKFRKKYGINPSEYIKN